MTFKMVPEGITFTNLHPRVPFFKGVYFNAVFNGKKVGELRKNILRPY